MASRNRFSRDNKTSNTRPAMKIYQKNRQDSTRSQPIRESTQFETIAVNPTATATASVNAQTSSLDPSGNLYSSHVDDNSTTIDHNHSSSHQTNFSSRNSLRTDLRTMGSMLSDSSGTSNGTGLERRIEDISNYVELNSDYFTHTVGGFIICMLCGRKERYIDNVSQAEHLTSERHSANLCRLKTVLLKTTPPETSIQMNALRELLTTWYGNYALTDDGYLSRSHIIDEFEEIISLIDPECQCRVVGSFATRTSLTNSDINLELIHPNSKLFEIESRSKDSIHHKLVDPDAGFGEQINYHTLHYDLVPNAVDTLDRLRTSIISYRGPQFNSFEVISELDDLNKKVPKLILRHSATSTRLEVCCYSDTSHKLTILLATYMLLDERARTLALLVKYWSEVCEINKPDSGTYPPDTFVILVIYYLQRTSPPVLPCLHEILFKNSNSTSDSKDINGVERDKLGTKAWTNTFSVLGEKDDAIDVNDNQDNNTELDDEDVNEDHGEDNILIDFNNEEVANLNWTSKNNSSLHMLFIDFFRFMMEEFNDIQGVISIRSLRRVSIMSKGWHYCKIKGVENPVKPTANISRCIGNLRSFEYIKNCFSQGYYYLTSLPLDSNLKPKDENQPYPQDFIQLYININRLDSYYAMREKKIRSNSTDYDPVQEMVQQGLFDRDVAVLDSLYNSISPKATIGEFSATVANFYDIKLLKPRDTCATKFCRLCKKTGHPKEGCGKAEILNLDYELENYDIDLDLNASLDPYFLEFYNRDSISPQLSNRHKKIVLKLTEIINSSTGLDCQLELFGSTINNLGSYNSDLDICVTLKSNPRGNGVDCVWTLRQIHDVLKTEREVSNIEAIFATRVPILKFMYSKFAIDLSMYNKCAIHNSQLLKAYAMIDKRFAQLFYLVKRYAKACDIAYAAQGSLSSYAWGIMVIHYLQRTSPPILPVLQDNGTAEKPMFGVNGWNVWFNSDIKSISMKRNDMTLTHLFKGFLMYFVSFEYNRYVISIRRLEPISKFAKNWHHCMIALEDPFELTYNLSSRLDDRMAIYIINSFALTFKHIVSLQERLIRDSRPLTDRQIFNAWDMTGGQKPPYRGCRRCHKVGHKVENCDQRIQRHEPNRLMKKSARNGNNSAQ